MSQKPLLSFITITFNGLFDTIELINSIQEKIKSISFEIIVVDNASDINEAKIISERFSAVRTIRSEKNLGFSGGNNLGIIEAIGDYIFIINNDTYFKEDTLWYLIDRLQNDSNIGAVGPKICSSSFPNHIQFAGYTPLTNITLRNNAINYGTTEAMDESESQITPYLHGAAMLVKRSVIDKVGLMPEIYFLYYEEIDWCTSISKAGFKLWYENKSTIYHKESQSTGINSPLKTYYLSRNRLLYAWRHLSPSNRILSVAYQIAIANIKAICIYTVNGEINNAIAVIKGAVSFFLIKNKGLNNYLKKQ